MSWPVAMAVSSVSLVVVVILLLAYAMWYETQITRRMLADKEKWTRIDKLLDEYRTLILSTPKYQTKEEGHRERT